jgi:hypothetical protein
MPTVLEITKTPKWARARGKGHSCKGIASGFSLKLAR